MSGPVVLGSGHPTKSNIYGLDSPSSRVPKHLTPSAMGIQFEAASSSNAARAFTKVGAQHLLSLKPSG
jgi:hypothetical protein